MNKLNEQQQLAVNTLNGAVLIVAGAGSGKTSTVIARIQNLVDHKVDPSKILAITFTNKAALELRERLSDKTSDVQASTIHALCFNLLRQYGHAVGITSHFSILSASETIQVIRNVINDVIDNVTAEFEKTRDSYVSRINELLLASERGEDHTLEIENIRAALEMAQNKYARDINVWRKDVKPYDMLQGISKAKRAAISAEKYAKSDLFHATPDSDYINYVYGAYQEHLTITNCLDFDDLLVKTYHLLMSDKPVVKTIQSLYDYVMVDEYQDVDVLQDAIINKLVERHQNICVVGDPDQSIYGWRGADVSLIQQFPSKHKDTKVISLKKNYRSAQAILDLANNVIKHNYDENAALDPLNAHKTEVVTPVFEEYEDAYDEVDTIVNRIETLHEQGVPYKEMAILFRVSALANPYESVLTRHNIPYSIPGGFRFYDRQEIKGMLAYLILLANPQHEQALITAISSPNRGIGAKTLQKIRTFGLSQQAPLNMLASMNRIHSISGIPDTRKAIIYDFMSMFQTIVKTCQATPLNVIVQQIADYVDYPAYIETLSSGQDSEDRMDNFKELLALLKDFDLRHASTNGEAIEPLSARASEFLGEVMLDATDKGTTKVPDAVQLLTIHTAKGLEFDTVFVIGAEEGIFPSYRSFNSGKALAEERRLMYVAITRAKRNLFVSAAIGRQLYGSHQSNPISRFVKEANFIEPDEENDNLNQQ